MCGILLSEEGAEALAESMEHKRAPVIGQPAVALSAAGEDEGALGEGAVRWIEQHELRRRCLGDEGPAPARRRIGERRSGRDDTDSCGSGRTVNVT